MTASFRALKTRLPTTCSPRTLVRTAICAALVATGCALLAPRAMAQPDAKAHKLQTFDGIYRGDFTYTGPKGHFDGTAVFSITTRDNIHLVGLLLLVPDQKHREETWTCRIKVNGVSIEILDAIPFDKGKTDAEGTLLPFGGGGGRALVTDLLPFKQKNIEGSVRLEWEKDGSDLELSMTVRTRKGDKRQPTIRVGFSGTSL